MPQSADPDDARLRALAAIAWGRILAGDDGLTVLLELCRDVRALDPARPSAPAGAFSDEAPTAERDVWQEGDTVPPEAGYEPRRMDEMASRRKGRRAP